MVIIILITCTFMHTVLRKGNLSLSVDDYTFAELNSFIQEILLESLRPATAHYITRDITIAKGIKKFVIYGTQYHRL